MNLESVAKVAVPLLVLLIAKLLKKKPRPEAKPLPRPMAPIPAPPIPKKTAVVENILPLPPEPSPVAIPRAKRGFLHKKHLRELVRMQEILKPYCDDK